jgi:hypothetical protein
MPAVLTKELIRSLASANGLNLPEARLKVSSSNTKTISGSWNFWILSN